MRFCFESRRKSELCLVTTRVAPAMVHADGVLAINGYHERALRTRSCVKSQVVQAELEEIAPLTRACGQRRLWSRSSGGPDRIGGADLRHVEKKRPDPGKSTEPCLPDSLCPARYGCGLRDSGRRNPRAVASGGGC